MIPELTQFSDSDSSLLRKLLLMILRPLSRLLLHRNLNGLPWAYLLNRRHSRLRRELAESVVYEEFLNHMLLIINHQASLILQRLSSLRNALAIFSATFLMFNCTKIG